MNRRTFVAGTTASGVALQLNPSPAAPAEPESAGAHGSETYQVHLTVNGQERALALDPRVTLLDALRDHVGLTGTKKGCDQGTCGACTVLVNGRRIDSCLTLAVMHGGDQITTVEGVAPQGGAMHPVQRAFIDKDAFQCGYCTSGQVVSAVALLSEGGPLDRDAVRKGMSGNICRCGCYPHIVDAILEAHGS